MSEASDIGQSLDLLLKDEKLRILDWHRLPAFHGQLREGRAISLYVPVNILDEHHGLEKVPFLATAPAVSIHWRKIPPSLPLLRAALPVLYVGCGFRKNVVGSLMASGIRTLLKENGLEPRAITILATSLCGQPRAPCCAIETAGQFPKPGCPVIVGRNIFRVGEKVTISRLADFNPDSVDMLSLVIIGNSESRHVGKYLLTPRGYPSRAGQDSRLWSVNSECYQISRSSVSIGATLADLKRPLAIKSIYSRLLSKWHTHCYMQGNT